MARFREHEVVSLNSSLQVWSCRTGLSSSNQWENVVTIEAAFPSKID